MLGPTPGLTPEGVCSYGDQKCIKPPFRNPDTIILERKDVALNGLTDVANCSLAGFSLRNATRQAGALRNPETILAKINDCLAHGLDAANVALPPQVVMSAVGSRGPTAEVSNRRRQKRWSARGTAELQSCVERISGAAVRLYRLVKPSHFVSSLCPQNESCGRCLVGASPCGDMHDSEWQWPQSRHPAPHTNVAAAGRSKPPARRNPCR